MAILRGKKIRFNRGTGEGWVVHDLALEDTGCNVTGVIHDGELQDVACENNGCNGDCILQTVEDGAHFEHWCDCAQIVAGG
jgi:hypothetical protein